MLAIKLTTTEQDNDQQADYQPRSDCQGSECQPKSIIRAKARRNAEAFTKLVGSTLNDDNWVYDAKHRAKLIQFFSGTTSEKPVEIEKQQFRKRKPDLKKQLQESVKLEVAKSVAKKSPRKPS